MSTGQEVDVSASIAPPVVHSLHGRDPATHLNNRMNPKQRLDRALQIRAALTALMTDDEADTYEVIDEHLAEYINELSLAYEATLDPL